MTIAIARSSSVLLGISLGYAAAAVSAARQAIQTKGCGDRSFKIFSRKKQIESESSTLQSMNFGVRAKGFQGCRWFLKMHDDDLTNRQTDVILRILVQDIECIMICVCTSLCWDSHFTMVNYFCPLNHIPSSMIIFPFHMLVTCDVPQVGRIVWFPHFHRDPGWTDYLQASATLGWW